MNPLAETAVVFSHELRRSLRSAKTLVLLILYSLASVLAGLVFVAATRKLQESLPPHLSGENLPPEALLEMKMGGLALFFGRDETLLRYLAGIPLVVVFFFWFTRFFLPLLIVLMGFDQISGELQARSLRYVSLRVRRGALLAGKVLAQIALLLGLTAIINLGLFVYAALTTENFAVLTGLLALLKFWLLALVFGTTYVALTALCSALFRTPVFSLLTALCTMFGFWVLAVLSRFSDGLRFLQYLTPSYYEDFLVSPLVMVALGSVAAYACFAAIFLALSYLTLRARDL